MSDTQTPERPVVQIDIRSTHPRAGKTTIAAVIAHALEAHGFTNIQVSSPEGDFPSRADNPPKLGDFYIVPQIVINDNNQRVSVKKAK